MKRTQCKMKMWMVEGDYDPTRLETRTKEIIDVLFLFYFSERDEIYL